MFLELFDNDRKRIAIVDECEYYEFTKSFFDVGKRFSLKVKPSKESLETLNQAKYILFDRTSLGEILSVNVASEDDTIEDTIIDDSLYEVSGFLIKNIISIRTITPQFDFTGTPKEFMLSLVSKQFKTSDNQERNVDILEIADASSVVSTEQITKQLLGSNVAKELDEVTKQYLIGYDVIPSIVDATELSDVNIDKFIFSLRNSVDRSVSQSVNQPIVFGDELDNLSGFRYAYSEEEFKNLLLVAGEGEGSARVIEPVTDEQVVLTADANTICLLHFDELVDEARPTATISAASQTVLSNEKSFLPGKAGRFKSQSTDSAFTITSPAIPAGNFTVEWWEYREELMSTGGGAAFASSTADTTGALLCHDTPSQTTLVARAGSANTTTYNILPNNTPAGDKLLNQWVHRAIVRDGTTIKIFQNGILYNSVSGMSTAAPYRTTNSYIGKYFGSSGFKGYIDEFRVSNVARYSGNFVPSRIPFTFAGSTEFVRKSGLERKEVFIDARDLQSVNENVTLTFAQYKELLRQRGLDKKNQHMKFETIEGTVVLDGNSYKYGEDFAEGDKVTLLLKEIGKYVDVIISSVTFSYSEGQEYIDVIFGEEEFSTYDKLLKGGVIT